MKAKKEDNRVQTESFKNLFTFILPRVPTILHIELHIIFTVFFWVHMQR